MDRQTLNGFRDQLLRRRSDLAEKVRAHLLKDGEQAEERDRLGVRDEGDDSILDMVETLGLARNVREALELRRVELALDRIRAGNYGICVSCGEDIPVERLQVEPTAERCVACQSRYEQIEGGEGSTL